MYVNCRSCIVKHMRFCFFKYRLSSRALWVPIAMVCEGHRERLIFLLWHSFFAKVENKASVMKDLRREQTLFHQKINRET